MSVCIMSLIKYTDEYIYVMSKIRYTGVYNDYLTSNIPSIEIICNYFRKC